MSKEENRFQEQKHKERARKYVKDILKEEKLARDEKFIRQGSIGSYEAVQLSNVQQSKKEPVQL